MKTRTQGAATRAPKATVLGGKPAVATNSAATPVEAKRKTSPMQFLNEVRTEARKITWPSWKETWITSVMVGIMVVATAVFFLVVDGALNFLMQQFLSLAVK